MAFIVPMHRNKPNITYLLDQPGVGVTTPLKGFWQKIFSRIVGHDWLMLKDQPITTKHSAESFLLKAF